MAIRRLTLTLIFFFVGMVSAAPQKQLRQDDVHKVMNHLFQLHVEVKEMSPEVLRRSYAIFADQADPMKVYLLEEELRPFLSLNQRHLKQAVARYRKGNFEDYKILNVLVQKGIERSRYYKPQLQEEVAIWIIQGREPGPLVRREEYPKSVEEMKHRQREQLFLFASRAIKRSGREVSSSADLQDVWALYDRRLSSFEAPYLAGQDETHYLSLHMLKSLAKSLDSHTAYFSPNEALSMRTQLEKGFTGIGVVLEDSLDGVSVAKIISGGPAAKNEQLQKRDVIVEIDGESIVADTFEKVLERLRGPEGTTVELLVRREEERISVVLPREQITMEDSRVTAGYEFFGDGIIGTITLDSFYEGANGISSAKDIRKAIEDFRKVAPVKGLVLDLRDNLGGFLTQAIKVAGIFITNGVVAMSKYSDGAEIYFRDLDGHAVYDGPLVVLTSKASASAAEIVAQSLQDYGVAIVVGDSRTYGKGSIQHQTITDADADVFFKVTVGRYYTVSGKSTQIEGVKADIVVPTALFQEKIGEEHLEYPLAADQMRPAFRDSLVDIDPSMRRWFVKYYLPTLQKRQDHITRYLGTLRKNSNFRVESSRNFQQFIEEVKQEKIIVFDEEELKEANQSNDLQLDEAVNIVKDIIILQTEEQKDAA